MTDWEVLADQQAGLASRALDSMPVGVAFTDAQRSDQPLVYVNKALEDMTGYRAAELIGKQICWLRGSDAGWAELGRLNEAFKQGLCGRASLPAQRKDGGGFVDQVRLAPITGTDGHITHYMSLHEALGLTAPQDGAAETAQLRQFVADFPAPAAFIAHGEPELNAAALTLINEGDEDTADYRREIQTLLRASAAERVPGRRLACLNHQADPPRWVELACYPMATGTLALLYDVTAQKLAEADLRHTERRLRSVVETVPNAIITIDQNGIVQSVNQAAAKMIGYGVEEVIGQNVSMLMHAADAAGHDGHIARYLRTGERRIIGRGQALSLRHKQGRTVPIFLMVDEIALGRTRLFTGVLQDLTETQRLDAMQRARGEILEKLAGSESLEDLLQAQARAIDSVVPGGRCAIFLIDPLSDQLRCAAAPSLAAAAIEALVARSARPDTLCSFVRRTGEGVVVEQLDRSARFGYLATLLEPAHVQAVWAEPVAAPGSIVLGVMVLFLEQARAPLPMEREFLAEQSRLSALVVERVAERDMLQQAQKMQAIGRLTSGIAHDFNNLLAIIQGNLEMLARRPDLDERARSRLDDALDAAGLAGDLVARLRALGRNQSLAPETLSVNAAIRDAAGLLEPTLPESIRLSTDLAPDLPRVRVDRVQLQSALLNLALNARDAMPDGGDLTIRSFLIPPETGTETRVAVQVRDTGMGIPAEIQDLVFDPYFTTKGSGAGTGLGLSMVESFAKQSGGDVRLRSAASDGTRVTILLPPAPED